jgi:hypothetical protein
MGERFGYGKNVSERHYPNEKIKNAKRAPRQRAKSAA